MPRIKEVESENKNSEINNIQENEIDLNQFSETVVEEDTLDIKFDDSEDFDIDGIKLTEIKKIDKLPHGMYIIELNTGETKEVSLDFGEAAIIDHHLNRHLNSQDDVLTSDEKSSAEILESLPKISVVDLERNLGEVFDVQFIHPDLRGFWACNEDIPIFLKYGYVYCKANMIKFFDSTFRNLKPGEGFNPESPISINGLTLMVCRKETQEAIMNHHLQKMVNVDNNKKIAFKPN